MPEDLSITEKLAAIQRSRQTVPLHQDNPADADDRYTKAPEVFKLAHSLMLRHGVTATFNVVGGHQDRYEGEPAQVVLKVKLADAAGETLLFDWLGEGPVGDSAVSTAITTGRKTFYLANFQIGTREPKTDRHTARERQASKSPVATPGQVKGLETAAKGLTVTQIHQVLQGSVGVETLAAVPKAKYALARDALAAATEERP